MRKMLTLPAEGGSACLFPAEGKAPLMAYFCFRDPAEEGKKLLSLLPEGKLSLLSYAPLDPDGAYTPWPAAHPSRGFSGGMPVLRETLRMDLLPAAREVTGAEECWALGYSLGGLAALVLSCGEEALFTRCGSCSGSLWYPGFEEWLRTVSLPERVYLSLGGKEKNSPDPMMAPVEEKTRAASELLRRHADCVLVMEPGGHFRDPVARLSRAMGWLLEK